MPKRHTTYVKNPVPGESAALPYGSNRKRLSTKTVSPKVNFKKRGKK